MSRLRGRVDRLEKVRADRQHLLAEPYPAHTKEPIDYEAVGAVTRELLESSPMGKEAALDLLLRSIPNSMRKTSPSAGVESQGLPPASDADVHDMEEEEDA